MSMTRRIAIVSMVAAVILAGSPSAQSRDDRQARLERRVCALVSPSTPYYAFFQSTVRDQFHWPGDSDTFPVLLVTWFPFKPPRTAERLFVDHTGQISIGRTVCDLSAHEDIVRRLEPDELLNVRSMLASVQPSYVAPAVNRLVLVSFMRRGIWCTYAYDEDRLPKSYIAVLSQLKIPVRKVV